MTGQRALIEGKPALIVVDIQADTFAERDDNPIPVMDGYAGRVGKSRQLIDKARELDIPVIFIMEVHRPDGIDFGRELDGVEGVHNIETDPGTEIAAEMDFRPDDYVIRKRRYSAFFGTDFDILLRGLKIDTLLLCGGLTDVCIHYTFVDGHQHDYFCRVVEDCVAGSSEDAHDASLRAMEYLQTGARCSLRSAIEAMQSSADKATT